MNENSIGHIIKLLIEEYGDHEWKPHDDPISVLVQTILSQNTSDRNSGKAFESLKGSFNGWEDIANSRIDEIADTIRAGGLAEVKAKYIKQALHEIIRERGKLELDFLKEFPLDKARNWLLQLPGVGMKTAACVLLFSLMIPALPVDTHVFRISKRLGLISPKTPIDQAHRLLENNMRSDDIYIFHILVIEHGRKICKSQRPYCHQCVLKMICPSYEKLSRLN